MNRFLDAHKLAKTQVFFIKMSQKANLFQGISFDRRSADPLTMPTFIKSQLFTMSVYWSYAVYESLNQKGYLLEYVGFLPPSLPPY